VNQADDANETEQARADAVIADLVRMRGVACTACRRVLCGHEALLSRAMGYRDTPHCHACLAARLGSDPEQLRDHLHAHLLRRPCHRQGWEWADREEGVVPPALPACLWPAGATLAQAPAPPAPAGAQDVVAAATFDAGDMGCGDLVLELRLRLSPMAPGQVLELIARDPGAPEDIPAWCGMTGHRLLRASPPRYWIRRKDG
jgi:tRNA 2-thiouridine synthesizing protein A